jgi:F0F1-type ATP synthase assembly protein I
MTLSNMPTNNKGPGGKFGSTALYVAVPGILLAGPMIGFFAGRWADGKLNTDPWLSAAGLFLGFGAAGKEIYNLIRKAQAMDDKEGDK